MSSFVLYPFNDNEKKGLPADIDLLENAIIAIHTQPLNIKRVQNMRDISHRVLEQLKLKLRNVSLDVEKIRSHQKKTTLETLDKAIKELKNDPYNMDSVLILHDEILSIL